MSKVNKPASSEASSWLAVAKKVQSDSKDWAGTLDENGKAKQVLVVKIGDKFGAVQDNGQIAALEGATDMESAKTAARSSIKAGKFPGAIGFKSDIAAAMESASKGGNVENSNTNNTETATGSSTNTATQTSSTSTADRDAKLAAIVKEYPKGGVAPLKIQDKDKKESIVLLGSKDGGKTYEARDANGQTVALKTPKNPKDLLNDENKKILKSAIDNGFGSSGTTAAASDSNVPDARSDIWSKYASDTTYTPVPIKDSSDKEGLVYLHDIGTPEKPSWEIVDFNGKKTPFTPTSTDKTKILQEAQVAAKTSNLVSGPSATAAEATPNTGTDVPAPVKPNSDIGNSNTQNPEIENA